MIQNGFIFEINISGFIKECFEVENFRKDIEPILRDICGEAKRSENDLNEDTRETVLSPAQFKFTAISTEPHDQS